MLFKILLFILLIISNLHAENLKKNCVWLNRNGTTCIVISKTPNTSEYSEIGINKITLSKEQIENLGAIDINDAIKNISGLDIFQSGSKGQTTSIFTRGSESNHTLVMINGIAINDQSVTDGLHDFGQDFIHNIQAIEIYKGASGAHFGPNSIAGAINFITSIDYTNSYSIIGFSGKNNSSTFNYTKITDDDWHFNFTPSITFSETGSAIAAGSEYDGTENYQLNFNSEKWINDNIKFKSNIYSRKTVTDYDGSASEEIGYVSDNRFYTIQSSLEYISKININNIVFHYHNYDREYENSGYLDEYDSETVVIKGESKNKLSNKISFGYGSEYKYDWGSFENRGSYSASTKGYVGNFGIFSNIGYKLSDDLIISIYGRSDEHTTTGVNQTYKINLTKFSDKFKVGLTSSTGLRNPTLYELYGSDNYGITGNQDLKPERSITNELLFKFNLFKNIDLTSTFYKTKIYDQIEANKEYSKHENELTDINQEGVENEIIFNRLNETLSFYNIFSKSKKNNGQTQSRRPDLSYGLNYSIKKFPTLIGKINFNINYKHTGKYIDWDGSANSKQKSTDIVDLSISKKLSNSIFSLYLSNLLNERYEKPSTYFKEGRQIKIGYKKSF